MQSIRDSSPYLEDEHGGSKKLHHRKTTRKPDMKRKTTKSYDNDQFLHGFSARDSINDSGINRRLSTQPKDRQYEDLKMRFKMLRHEIIVHEEPKEFAELKELLDKSHEILQHDALQLIKIEEMNGVEKLSYFNEDAFLGKWIKKFLFVQR